MVGAPSGFERQKRNEVRYDEHPDLGCGGNRWIPDCVRTHRLLPVPSSSRVRDLNPRGRRRHSPCASRVHFESEVHHEQETTGPSDAVRRLRLQHGPFDGRHSGRQGIRRRPLHGHVARDRATAEMVRARHDPRHGRLFPRR